MSAPEGPKPSLDASVGAFGTVFSCFLAGVTFTQTVTYFSNFYRVDHLVLIMMTIGLKTIGMAHTAGCCHTVYTWTVSEYGNFAALALAPVPFAWGPFLTGLAAFIVQCFYAWRVFVVSGRKLFVPLLICSIALVQLAFATGLTYSLYQWSFQFADFPKYRYGVGLWLMAGVAADLLITFSLVHYLRACLSSTTDGNWRPLVRALVLTVVQTNGLTLLTTVVNAILFLADENTAWHVIPGLMLVQMYIVSALVSLNARTSLQRYAPISTQPTRSRITYKPYPSPESPDAGYPLVPPTTVVSRVSCGGPRELVRTASKRSVVNGIKVTQFREVATSGSTLEKQLEFELAAPLALSAKSSPNPFSPANALRADRGLSHSASFASIPEEPESPICTAPLRGGTRTRSDPTAW
ncbi:hypothetical protein JCM9279_005133 [Rhodotorula babjevae]